MDFPWKSFRLMVGILSRFDHLAGDKLRKFGLWPTILENTNPKLTGLLQRCWQQNPAKRPSFSEILEILKQIVKEVEANGGVNRRKDKASAGFFSAFKRSR